MQVIVFVPTEHLQQPLGFNYPRPLGQRVQDFNSTHKRSSALCIWTLAHLQVECYVTVTSCLSPSHPDQSDLIQA